MSGDLVAIIVGGVIAAAIILGASATHGRSSTRWPRPRSVMRVVPRWQRRRDEKSEQDRLAAEVAAEEARQRMTLLM